MANPTITQNENVSLVLENRGYPPVEMTIITGQGTLSKGSVLGVITASGKLKLVDDDNSDGSEDPKYVLLKEVDTSSSDVTAQREILAAGIVNANQLVFGGDDEIGDHHTALKNNGIVAVDADHLGGYDNT